jgi:hypothetical protein
MSNETLTLIQPTLTLKDNFCSLADEFLAEGDQRYREAIADLKASSNYALTRRWAATSHPVESHRVRFGSSKTGREF